MSETLRIGIAGLGTVGGGTLELLRSNAAQIEARCGKKIEVAAVAVRDARKKRGASLKGVRVVADAMALAEDKNIDVVVELIGGEGGTAKKLVERTLASGKHVVTANKALLAMHGQALALSAEKKNVTLAFEAAVAGGIPIISALRSGLAANRIVRVAGILNGTCNYILSTMQEARRDFAEVLAEAQELGYAEADPATDIDGTDAAHKVAILAALSFGTKVDFAGVHVEGIRRVSLLDIDYAASFGYRIKLLGIATMENGTLLQRVHPALVPAGSPLGVLNGPFNAVEVEGDAVGRVVFEGRGAGAGPTASAVVSDLMSIARGDRYAPFTVAASALRTAKAAALSAHRGCYYLRLSLKDEPGVLAEFTRAFAAQKISVHSITQRGIIADHSAQVVVLTHETDEASVMRAAAAITKLKVSVAPPVVLRIEP
ncbi:MAG: homoserine dehydrogenase [Alphaproteobacteria bacterium]